MSGPTKVFLPQIKPRVYWSILFVLVLILGVFSFAREDKPSNTARAKSISQQLRCLECEGLSVYDSETQTSKTIVNDVARRVKKGESSNSIFEYYEGIYGEYIRLSPTTSNGNWIIYVVPAFCVLVFLAALFLSIRVKTTTRMRAIYWCATGLIVIIGAVFFVHDSKDSTVTATKNQTESTQDLLEQAAKLSPTATNLRNLAVVQFAKEEYVDALKNFDAASKLDPTDAASRGYAAYIVLQAGEYEAALARAQAAVAAKKDDVTALFFRGTIYYVTPETGATKSAANKAAANRDFDRVLQLAPTSSFASQISELRATDK